MHFYLREKSMLKIMKKKEKGKIFLEGGGWYLPHLIYIFMLTRVNELFLCFVDKQKCHYLVNQRLTFQTICKKKSLIKIITRVIADKNVKIHFSDRIE